MSTSVAVRVAIAVSFSFTVKLEGDVKTGALSFWSTTVIVIL